MKTHEILDVISNKGFDVRYSWSKNYGNGTSLFEYKIYKTSRHRKPLAFVQIGFHNESRDVIGATFSYMPKPNEIIDIEGGQDTEKILNKCLEKLA